MRNLQAPSLDAARDQWEAWHRELLAMRSRAPSVVLALRRAQAVLAEGQVTPAAASHVVPPRKPAS